MAIKIGMLRSFSTVAQCGNLAEAATRLGRTQSAVSMTLKQLEEHLGQKLFEGERKNLLTPLGLQVFELAQHQLRRFDDTVNAIEASARAPRGLLRIASVPSVAGLIFPSAIDQMTRSHPGLTVELRDMDTQRVIDSLVHGQADLGIASGRHALNGIREAPLFEDRFGLLCSSGHALSRRVAPPTIDDLRTPEFLRNNLCKLIVAPEFHAAMAEARVTVHNTLSLIGMVRTGRWLTVLPQMVARIVPGDLMFRPISGLDERRPVVVLIRERSQHLHLAEELADIVLGFDWG